MILEVKLFSTEMKFIFQWKFALSPAYNRPVVTEKRCKLWNATFLVLFIPLALGYLILTTNLKLSHTSIRESVLRIVQLQ